MARASGRWQSPQRWRHRGDAAFPLTDSNRIVRLFPKILTRGELKEFRAPLDDLIGLARDEIDRLFARIGPDNYVVLLTDAKGVTVNYRCTPALIGEARRNGLYEGAIWAETEQGTNGVGICLHEARPLSIVMDEHFSVRNTALTCTVAPIFGAGGRVLGVLDVSTARPTSQAAQAAVREREPRGRGAAHAARLPRTHGLERHGGGRAAQDVTLDAAPEDSEVRPRP